jgi:hypothetical protein
LAIALATISDCMSSIERSSARGTAARIVRAACRASAFVTGVALRDHSAS